MQDWQFRMGKPKIATLAYLVAVQESHAFLIAILISGAMAGRRDMERSPLATMDGLSTGGKQRLKPRRVADFPFLC